MCRHDFFLNIFQFLFPLTNISRFSSPQHCWAVLPFIYISVSTHLLPLLVLVKQNREITRLALSEITQTAF